MSALGAWSIVWLVLAAIFTYGMILPAQRRWFAKTKLQSGELLAHVWLVLALGPMSAALITLLGIGGLVLSYDALGYIWMLYFHATIPNPISILRGIGIPEWVPFLVAFAAVYLAIAVNGIVDAIKTARKTDRPPF